MGEFRVKPGVRIGSKVVRNQVGRDHDEKEEREDEDGPD